MVHTLPIYTEYKIAGGYFSLAHKIQSNSSTGPQFVHCNLWCYEYITSRGILKVVVKQNAVYEGWLIRNAHSEIFCRRSKVVIHAQCVLVTTTLLHSGAKFHSFL